MLSRKEQISAVKELIEMNKAIVDINIKMAKLHIKKKKIKKAKKSTLNAKKNSNSFFDIFMEEAHKMILQDAIEYWIEEHNINSEEVLTTTKVEKTCENNLLDSNNSNKNIDLSTKLNSTTKENKLKVESKSIKDKEINKNKSNKIVEKEKNATNSLFSKSKSKISAKDLFKDAKNVEESSQLSFAIF